MVNVTNRTDINMRLRTFKFALCHRCQSLILLAPGKQACRIELNRPDTSARTITNFRRENRLIYDGSILPP
ncbi:hypothetical protein HNQ74_001354 [Bartonella doshiae]|nr:hypothetical protein [Bartonella doshiae]